MKAQAAYLESFTGYEGDVWKIKGDCSPDCFVAVRVNALTMQDAISKADMVARRNGFAFVVTEAIKE